MPLAPILHPGSSKRSPFFAALALAGFFTGCIQQIHVDQEGRTFDTNVEVTLRFPRSTSPMEASHTVSGNWTASAAALVGANGL